VWPNKSVTPDDLGRGDDGEGQRNRMFVMTDHLDVAPLGDAVGLAVAKAARIWCGVGVRSENRDSAALRPGVSSKVELSRGLRSEQSPRNAQVIRGELMVSMSTGPSTMSRCAQLSAQSVFTNCIYFGCRGQTVTASFDKRSCRS
jgi:hypothetical protein